MHFVISSQIPKSELQPLALSIFLIHALKPVSSVWLGQGYWTMNSIDWVWDQSLGVHFHAPSNTYAITSNGEWTYIPAADFKPGQSSISRPSRDTKLEDGEVEDDVGWGALMDDPTESKSTEQPVSTAEAQVLRLVVLRSEVLDLGTIAMIDTRPEGIQIGRDKQPGQLRVRLKEMAVSKTHAVVYKGDDWCIVDLGSTHGTFVDHSGESSRLSEPKHASQPRSLVHLDQITIGSTTFAAHIHPDWPCEDCQIKADNVLELSHDAVEVEKPSTGTPSRQPGPRGHHEMTLLKQTLLKDNGVQNDNKQNKYLDRSRIRREQERASPRRSVSPPRAVGDSAPRPPAFAARMLSKQGWVEGRGLGVQQDGIAEPISVKANMDKRGLGEEEEDWRERGKKRRWREVQ